MPVGPTGPKKPIRNQLHGYFEKDTGYPLGFSPASRYLLGLPFVIMPEESSMFDLYFGLRWHSEL